MKYNLTYKQFNERSLLIEWPEFIDEQILNSVLNFRKAIENLDIKSIVEVNHAYNSILIIYDSTIDNVNDKINGLKQLYLCCCKSINLNSCLWEIPVCYDDEFGMDIDTLSKQLHLPKSEIVKRHSQQIYTIYFVGFLPGFLYLGGLHDSLYCDRKSTPNLSVKKGAVGIGGNQTGIYPQNSPGGWHIIGNSPISFFNPKDENPCFAKAGDKIKFQPITKPEYESIAEAFEGNTFNLKPKHYND